MTVVSDWYHTIPNIIDTIVEAKPASILDVGMSLGKYGLLIRETLDTSFRAARQGKTILRVDGLELLRNHRSRLQEVLYNQIYYLDDISSIKPLPTYDAILLGDVLPKLEKEFGYQLIDKLLHKTKKVLIATAPTFARRSSTSDVSRWWELDFTEFDAEIFRVSTGSSDHRVFKIYPSSRRTLQIPRRVRGTTVKSNKKRPLNIAYCVPHKNLTGGVKTLLDQMKQLRMRGHRVAAVYQGESHERAVPGWADVEFDEEIVISRVSDIQQLRGKFDVIIAGWVQQLPELVESKIPLFYWEKGHEWLFGDYAPGLKAGAIRRHLEYCYSTPCEIASVSSIVSDLLRERYGRCTPVIPNGIDLEVYFPSTDNRSDTMKTILLVGNPRLRFKGFDVAMRTLTRVWEAGHRFQVRWVCQVKPTVTNVPFPIEFVVSPPQTALPSYYREADIHLFTSWYEGFGMPPLEAMASGVAVVVTDCGGVSEYVEPGDNALVADPGDIDSLAGAIAFLLEDNEARKYLAHQGRKTAERFSITKASQMLEEKLLMMAK